MLYAWELHYIVRTESIKIYSGNILIAILYEDQLNHYEKKFYK